MQAVLREVLKTVKPVPEEERRVKALVTEVVAKLKLPQTTASLGGSGAKGTWLHGTHDVDIYVQFDKKTYQTKDISVLLGAHLKKKFSQVTQLHGSRDYFQIRHGGFTFEIVPILKIRKADEAVNITDISPLHARWVTKHKKGDQIRLAKAFCRAQGCYGAESYIQGFSGYVLEILTIRYGSFEKLLRGASQWGKREWIDVARHGKYLNPSKAQSPLIVIDPVQADRNAAAALGQEKYARFILSAQRFLHQPSLKFFEQETVTLELLQKKAAGRKLVLLEVVPLQGKHDIVGAKLLKAFEFCKQRFHHLGFPLRDSGWAWNQDTLFWFIFTPRALPKEFLHEGPRLTQTFHVSHFQAKYKGRPFVKRAGRIYAKLQREHTTVDSFLPELLHSPDLHRWVNQVRSRQ